MSAERKFVVTSEVHGNVDGLRVALRYAGALGAEHICCGNLTARIREAGSLRRCVEAFEACIDLMAGSGVTTFVVPGNHELTYYYAKAVNDRDGVVDIHGRALPLGPFRLVGYGGNVEVPFPPEGEIGPDYGFWKECDPDILDSLLQGPDPRILVTHTPPRGYLDAARARKPVGDIVLQGLVQRHRPLLSVFGHVPGNAGCVDLRGAPVGPGIPREALLVNAGGLSEGLFAVVGVRDRKAVYGGHRRVTPGGEVVEWAGDRERGGRRLLESQVGPPDS